MKANLKKLNAKQLTMLHDALAFVITYDNDQERRYTDATPKSETKFLKKLNRKIEKLIPWKS